VLAQLGLVSELSLHLASIMSEKMTERNVSAFKSANAFPTTVIGDAWSWYKETVAHEVLSQKGWASLVHAKVIALTIT
jgi:hypothetical protein